MSRNRTISRVIDGIAYTATAFGPSIGYQMSTEEGPIEDWTIMHPPGRGYWVLLIPKQGRREFGSFDDLASFVAHEIHG